MAEQLTLEGSMQLLQSGVTKWIAAYIDQVIGEEDTEEREDFHYEGMDALVGLSAEDHLGGLTMILVHGEGGGEGEGEHVERVFAILPVDKVPQEYWDTSEWSRDSLNLKLDGVLAYARIEGYYQSYEGTEWDDDWEEVEPAEVVVVQYFKKGN